MLNVIAKTNKYIFVYFCAICHPWFAMGGYEMSSVSVACTPRVELSGTMVRKLYPRTVTCEEERGDWQHLHLLSSDFQFSNCKVEKGSCLYAINKLTVSLCECRCLIFTGMSLWLCCIAVVNRL